MAHRSARLSVFARQLLVDRVTVLGKPVAMVATELGVSRATGYKWIRRYRSEGSAGLDGRSSRPHRSPRALAREQVEAILAARVARRYGPHRLAYLTGHPRSTISDVLARAGAQLAPDQHFPHPYARARARGGIGGIEHREGERVRADAGPCPVDLREGHIGGRVHDDSVRRGKRLNQESGHAVVGPVIFRSKFAAQSRWSRQDHPVDVHAVQLARLADLHENAASESKASSGAF